MRVQQIKHCAVAFDLIRHGLACLLPLRQNFRQDWICVALDKLLKRLQHLRVEDVRVDCCDCLICLLYGQGEDTAVQSLLSLRDAAFTEEYLKLWRPSNQIVSRHRQS